MLSLIKGAEVYSPEPGGKKDILIGGGKILKIAAKISSPRDFGKIDVIDAQGLICVPGFIDGHVHIAGGGGEGGFQNRTPEIQLSHLTTAGITCVIGLLGTDGSTRSIPELLAKARGLEAEGISTFIYTGAYEVPTRTITGSARSDIILIDKIIGVGEIAISDHRSSHPSEQELARLVSEARVGGIISGKAGVVHIHLGDDHGKMEPLFKLFKDTEIPITQAIPTHVNRNPYVFEDAISFGKMGGFVDVTSGIFPREQDKNPIKPSIAIKALLEEGVPLSHITMSSDGNGSAPVFDKKGILTGLSISSVKTLWREARDLVIKEGLDLSQALYPITQNVANVLKISDFKGQVREGLDADLVLLTRELDIHTVIGKGKTMVENKIPKVFGTFELSGK